MGILRFEAPLHWPDGFPVTPRTQQRNDHGFVATLTLPESINYLEEELKELKPNAATLSLDIDQPLVERLRKKVGSRSGASLHIKYHGRAYVLACDRWVATEHNVYALHLALRQWRNIERWGVGSMPVLLHGFEANRPPITEGKKNNELSHWMEFLGLGPTATLEDAIAVYHRRAKLVGQQSEALSQLNTIMDEARSYFTNKGQP